MNKIDIARKVVTYAIGASTTHVVGSIIRNQLSPRNSLEKLEVAIGALAIGSLAAAATKDHAVAAFDKSVIALTQAFDENTQTETDPTT